MALEIGQYKNGVGGDSVQTWLATSILFGATAIPTVSELRTSCLFEGRTQSSLFNQPMKYTEEHSLLKKDEENMKKQKHIYVDFHGVPCLNCKPL